MLKGHPRESATGRILAQTVKLRASDGYDRRSAPLGVDRDPSRQDVIGRRSDGAAEKPPIVTGIPPTARTTGRSPPHPSNGFTPSSAFRSRPERAACTRLR